MECGNGELRGRATQSAIFQEAPTGHKLLHEWGPILTGRSRAVELQSLSDFGISVSKGNTESLVYRLHSLPFSRGHSG